MRFKLIISVVIVILASIGTSFFSYAATEFKPQSEKVLPTLGMVRKLSRQHYVDMPINDALSSQLLDEFIDQLDSSKIFFTQSDINSFEKLRHTLDDQLAEGEVQAAYTIYNVFHARVIKRLSTELDNIDKTIAALDFDKKEYIERDASDRAWATTQKEISQRWRLRIKNDVLSLTLAKKDNEAIRDLLAKRLKKQIKRFEQTNSDDVYTRYMNAYASLYDPHTSHFLPKRRENFDINMSRSLEGIGAVLSTADENTKVVRLVTGGPAEKQGDLKPSHRIIGVAQGLNGEFEDVVGWRLDEVVELIRGPKDSIVRLQVASKKEQTNGTSRNITIKRGKVQLADMLAKSEVIEIYHNEQIRKIGVIHVPDFYADMDARSRGEKEYRSVTRDVARLINELSNQNIEGLVVDLRNNGGGSLTEANNLTGLFINAGPTVQIRTAANKTQPDGKPRGRAYYRGPLVVMINRLSASASEIFAGAIQDYDRGLVVGTTSFGKGTVQTILPLAEGAIKLTTAKFYRISGDSTQYKGVIPDIAFPKLVDPEEVGESALDHALPWDTITPLRYRHYGDIEAQVKPLTRLHANRIKHDPDFTFFKQEYDLLQAQRQDDKIPLQMAERKAKQKQAETQFLVIENARRKAKGLDVLASIDDLHDDDEDDEDEALEVEKPEDKSYADDAFAVEAANILLDSIDLSQKLIASSPY